MLHTLGETVFQAMRAIYRKAPTRLKRWIEPSARDFVAWRKSKLKGKLLAIQDVLPSSAILANDQTLMRNIAAEFDVSAAFVEAYFQSQSLNTQGATSWAQLEAILTPLQTMYLHFAFTTSERAKATFHLIDKHLALSKRLNEGGGNQELKHLDIGCGYGGFVRAFAQAGYASTGVELVPSLVRFSQLNTEHLGDRARIIEGDFLKLDSGSWPAFDVITCNDVIEHVADAHAALLKMLRMLKPSGTLQMEIPNKDSIDFVISDGHFQLFGIAQLRREEAAPYYARLVGETDYLSHMGEFHEQSFYTDRMSQAGLKIVENFRHQIAPFEQAPAKLVALQTAWQQWQQTTRSKLEPVMAQMIDERISAYIARYEQAFSAARGQPEAEQRFIATYLINFWTLLGRSATTA